MQTRLPPLSVVREDQVECQCLLSPTTPSVPPPSPYTQGTYTDTQHHPTPAGLCMSTLRNLVQRMAQRAAVNEGLFES